MIRVQSNRGCVAGAVFAPCVLVLVAVGGASGESPETAPQPVAIRFERLAPTSLPRFEHFNGQRRASLLPEDNGSGCAWGDYDGDGDDDLFLCNMNGPLLMDSAQRRRLPGSRLWRNDGRGRFSDVTEQAGLTVARMDMGVVFADYDNDGDADLLVTSLNGVRLYRNIAGHYDDVTVELGLGSVSGYCLGAAWGDYDRDGRLDLYICRYVDFPIDKARNREIVAGRPAPMTTPGSYPPIANHLFHQEPDGTFHDVTESSGTAAAKGRSMQSVWCDFDNDGWIDIYVANDQSLDNLFRNKHDGTFEDLAMMSGLFDPRGAMGVALIDFNSDGDQDLFVTHWVGEDPAFYINDSSGGVMSFDDRANHTGMRKSDKALVGWGTGFVDFDNDGDQDLYVACGSTIEDELTLDVLKNPRMLPQKSLIYERRADRWYVLGAGAGAYFNETHVARGAAVSDFDGDGRPDLAINNSGGAPAILRNVSTGGGHWLKVRLTGRDCNKDAANARVTIHCDGSSPQMRELLIGSSYLSCDSKTLHFGVGPAELIERLEVRWPCGATQSIQRVPVNQTLNIGEPVHGAKE